MSQSTITEKRSVITSSTSSSGGKSVDDALADIGYKPSFGQRASNIMSRSIASPIRHSTGGGSSIVRTVEYGYGSHMGGGFGPGGYSTVSSTGVENVKSHREKEKRDMQDLNERFANYIEKSRFLEAQNRKLCNELDELRSKWGKETTQIKSMYEKELAEARKLIDDLSRDKAALEIKMSSMQEQFADFNRQLDEARNHHATDRDHINKLNQQLSDYESEIAMLRRSIESLETERARDKANINRLQQEVDKLRIDLNNETLAHLDAENRRQTLEEEMEFMKKVHEQELKELAALAYRDTTAENREFWKSELAQAIRDIQQEYDSKVDQLRGDMEGFYNLKIQEYRTGATKQNMEVTHIREENKKLTKTISDLRGKLADLEARNAQLEKQYQELLRDFDSKDSDHMMEVTQLREEISKLRAEMEGILTELQTLMDAKLSLELEISAYRKLLEGEENRVDWRSKASLIKYRDAFRNTQSTDQSGVAKSSVVTPSRQPELESNTQEASSDTGTASSITTSEPGISPKGDEIDSSSSTITTGDGRKLSNITDVSESKTELGENNKSLVVTDKMEKDQVISSHSEPIKEQPVTKVKDEVRKIENQIQNGIDQGVSDQITESPKTNKDTLDSRTENTPDMEDKTSVSETTEKEQIDSIDIDATDSKLRDEEPVHDTSHEKANAVEDDMVQEPNIDGDKDLSRGGHTSKITDDELEDTEGQIGNIQPSISTDETNENIDRQNTKNVGKEDDPNLGKTVGSVAEVDKQLPPDTKKVNTATELLSSVKSTEITDDRKSVENKIEKTEDKVLETNIPAAATEAANITRSEATTIELSPTKEKPGMDKISNGQSSVEEIDKKFSSEKPIPASDVSSSAISTEKERHEEIPQNKIEKTEDKILETKMPVEATEEASNTKTETATVELSPTKEKPRITGELQENGYITSMPGESSEKGLLQDESSEKGQLLDTDIVLDQEKNAGNETHLNKSRTEHIDEIILSDKTLNESAKITSKVESRSPDEKQSSPSLSTAVHDLDENGFPKGEDMLKNDNESKLTQNNINYENKIKTNVIEDEMYDKDHGSQPDDRGRSEIKTDDNDINLKEGGGEHQVLQPQDDSHGTSSDIALADNQSKLGDIKPADDKSESKTVINADPTNEKDQSEQTVSTNSLQVESESKSKIDMVIEDKNIESKHETDSDVNVKTDSMDLLIPTEMESATEGTEIKATEPHKLAEQLDTDQSFPKEHSLTDPSSHETDIRNEFDVRNETDVKELIQPIDGVSKIEDEIKVSSSDDPKHSPQDEIILQSDLKAEPTKSSKPDFEKEQNASQIIKDNVSNENKTSVQKEINSSPRVIAESPSKDNTGSIEENESLGTRSDIESPKESEMHTKSDAQSKPLSDSEISKGEKESSSITETDKGLQPKDETLMPDKSTPQKETTDNGPTDGEKGTTVDDKQLETKTPEPPPVSKPVTELGSPLTNGVLESPTEEPTDAVLGSSEGDDSQMSMKMMRGEVSAKTTYQRTSTGPIAISEVDTEGKFITLENTSSGPNRRDVNLDGWRLKRTVDGKRDYIYPFRNFTLKSGKAVKILARKAAGQAGLNDLVFRDEDNWGVGSQVTTSLINDKDEEKATHVQKTLYN